MPGATPRRLPVVFLPGGGQTRHIWGNTARALGERGWCAVSMDLRGHGESGWASDARDLLDDFVSDLRKVVETFDRAPDVGGASPGGVTWPREIRRDSPSPRSCSWRSLHGWSPRGWIGAARSCREDGREAPVSMRRPNPLRPTCPEESAKARSRRAWRARAGASGLRVGRAVRRAGPLAAPRLRPRGPLFLRAPRPGETALC